MSSKPKGSLSNPALSGKQVELTNSSTVIQVYVAVILQQPDLKLKALPKLPSHQKTARDHAQSWSDTILPLMAKTVADIIDYANQFDSFYEDLVKYAKDIKNPESKKNLVEGLKLLLSSVKRKDANVETVVNELSTFQKNLNIDYQNFQSDVNLAAVKIEGKDGELKALREKLDAVEEAIDKDKALVGGGATMIVLGGGMIIVGAMAAIPTGGATLPLLVGGVAIFTSGFLMTTIAAGDWRRQIEAQTDITEELARKNIDLAGLKTAKGQVTGFVKAIASATKAATSLKAAWQTLDADLDQLITAIQDVDPNIAPAWLLAELNRAKLDWEVALDQAKKMQPDGKVPIKVYKNIRDTFTHTKSPRQA